MADLSENLLETEEDLRGEITLREAMVWSLSNESGPWCLWLIVDFAAPSKVCASLVGDSASGKP